MIFRPETSLIPTVLALSSFFIDNFPNFWWYPHWYLGNPFSYLIGPVVPIILLISSRILHVNLYTLYLDFIIFCTLLGGIGVFFLVKEFGRARGGNIAASASGLLYIILPFSWLGIYFQNGLKQAAFAVIPFIFIAFKRSLALSLTPSRGRASRTAIYLLLVLLITITLLITVNILLPVIIGATAIFIGSSQSPAGKTILAREAVWRWREEQIIKAAIIFLLAISLASGWYTPRFWWVILSNPSFGGMPLWNLTIKLFQNILNFLPLLLAILVVKWRFFKFDRVGAVFFAFLFFLSFLFLTSARFLADPEFVTDWIGFLPELQFGISIITGVVLSYWLNSGAVGHAPKLKKYLINILMLTCGVILLVASGYLAAAMYLSPKSDYQKDIIGIFQSHIKDKNTRIFLSGTDVFWINSFLPLNQVRGGNDPSSIHPYWAHGSYQIREGETEDLTAYWLKIFGGSYVLVHQLDSKDTFKDFKHPDKFRPFQLLADNNGEKLFHVPNVSIARISGRSLLSLPEPKNGADSSVLKKYVSALKKPVKLNYLSPGVISLKTFLTKNEIISLAIAYDPGWKIIRGMGVVLPDSLGNIAIVPSGAGVQEFILAYERSVYDWIIPAVLIVLLSLFLWKFDYFYSKLRKVLPKFHIGLGSEDEDY